MKQVLRKTELLPKVILSLSSALALTLSPFIATAQRRTFNNGNVQYVLGLPSGRWRAVARPDDFHQHIDFIYGDGSGGHLRIRKEIVDEGTTPLDLTRRDQQELSLLPGYVEDQERKFAGSLSGIMFSYQYTSGGRPMAGRIYYLKANERTIYVLHFSGERDKFLPLGNQMDSMAVSFHLK